MKMTIKEENTNYGKIWKYESDDKTFSFAIYKYSDDDETYYLANVLVNEQNRGTGLGNVILNMAENIARDAGVKILCLKAKTSSFTHNWYKRHGYVDLRIDENAPLYTWMNKKLPIK